MESEKSKSLVQVLREFQPEVTLGPKEPSNEADLKALRRSLERISKSNAMHFKLAIAGSLAAFVVECALVFLWINNPIVIGSTLTVVSGVFALLVKQLSQRWKEKVASDLLLVLAANLRPQDLKGITALLLRYYFKK